MNLEGRVLGTVARRNKIHDKHGEIPFTHPDFRYAQTH